METKILHTFRWDCLRFDRKYTANQGKHYVKGAPDQAENAPNNRGKHMKIVKYLSKWAGIMLMSYGCLAAAKTTINLNVGNSPPPRHPVHEAMPPPGSHYFWKPVEYGRIPHRAFIGGQERDMILYVCQAYYRDGVHPGKVVGGNCNISWNGREIVLNNFKVLVGEGLYWRPGHYGRVPYNAVVGGMVHGRPLYVCHASYGRRGVHPGKLWENACYIAYGGQEIPMHDYEILVSQ